MAKFFKTQSDWRKWLEKNHARESELIVGFYKTSTGKPSITWNQSVDEALCFGWIDGVRKNIDEERYQIRFTPRKPTSNWSKKNIDRVKELIEAGLMHEAGLAAFGKRKDDKSAIYSYEQRKAAKLAAAEQKQLRANEEAWTYFSAQPPSYQRTAIHWVISAKRDETRAKRLKTLIEESAAGRWLKAFIPRKPKR